MAILQLSSLVAAAALMSLGLALPQGRPSTRGDVLEKTHDAGMRARAEVQSLARGGDEMIRAPKPNLKSAASLESKLGEFDTKDEKLRGGAELNGRSQNYEQKKPQGMAKSDHQEVHRSAEKPRGGAELNGRSQNYEQKKPQGMAKSEHRFAATTEVKSRKPVSVARKPISTGSRRLPKNSLLRGGADLQSRTKLEPRSEPQQLRVPADTRMDESHTLPIGRYPGQVKSANYPQEYPVSEDWTWTLKAEGSGTSSLTITCSDFLLEESDDCEYDYLSINGMKFCGSDAPPSITASLLKIEFSSDYSIAASGFSCDVEVHDGCCGRSGAGARIVGGAEVAAHSLPWQVGLVDPTKDKGQVFCGGSVLNSRFVITAAHCTDGMSASGIAVSAGLHNRLQHDTTAGAQLIAVRRIHQHANYNTPTLDRDISLLELDGELAFSDTVRPICLPRGGGEFSDVDVLVSGWGTLQSGGKQPESLHGVLVHTMTNSQCSKAYGSMITTNMMCAAGSAKDSCQGDSGGPLVAEEGGRFTQIGVVSFGAGCASASYPGVYVRVTKLLDWIDQKSLGGQVC